MAGISSYGFSHGNHRYSQGFRGRGLESAGSKKTDSDKGQKTDAKSKSSQTKDKVVFQETFEKTNGGKTASDFKKFDQFKVEHGSADVGHGVTRLTANRGRGTEIESRDDITLEAGTYELEVKVAGSQRTRGRDTVEIEVEVNGKDIIDDKHKVKDVSNRDIVKGKTDRFTTITKRFTVKEGSKLEFEVASKNGGEVIVDSVSLRKVSGPSTGGGGSGRTDHAKLDKIEKRLGRIEKGLSRIKGSSDGNNRATAANGAKIDRLAEKFSKVGAALKDVASNVSGVDAKADANGKRLDDLNTKFGDLSKQLASALGSSGNKKEIAALAKQTKEVATQVDKALGKSEENGRKIDNLGSKFDTVDQNSAARDKALSDKIDASSQGSAARDKTLGNKIDTVDQNSATRDAALDQKIDALGSTVNSRFDSVDTKLNDITTKLGGQVNGVSQDLSTAVTELKQVIKQVDATNDAQLSKTVKDLKADFNKQFDALKSQHEAESNALLKKLDELTSQLGTLSEQSSETIAILKDKLGGLGGQLGTVITKLDALGQGQTMSLRSIGLFNVAAKAGDGALDKLIGLVGPGGGRNQLRGVQSQLRSVSARFGGGQNAGGFSLLA